MKLETKYRNRLKHLYASLIVALLMQLTGRAQQDPQYTQYMYNMSVINPAYTTNNLGMLNFGALYRSQWKKCRRSTQRHLTFFAHAPLSQKIEMGVSHLSPIILAMVP